MDTLSSLHLVPAGWLSNSPLADYTVAYQQYLIDRGYAERTQRAYLYCVAHFARWITRRQRAVGDIGYANTLPANRLTGPAQKHGVRTGKQYAKFVRGRFGVCENCACRRWVLARFPLSTSFQINNLQR